MRNVVVILRVGSALRRGCNALLGLIALVSFVGVVHAAGECYRWQGVTAYFTDPQAACVNKAAAYTKPAGTTWNDAGTAVLSTWPNYACNRQYTTTATGVVSTSSTTMNGSIDPLGCPSCPASGTSRNLKNTPAVGTLGCAGGCEFMVTEGSFLSASGFSVGRGKSTGKACNANPNPHGDTSEEDCGSSGGNVACAETPPSKCGEVNGDRVCVGAVRNGCVAYESGGVACVAESVGGDSATPPAPDNGTPGTPAEPDAQVTSGGTTVNYFNNTTVNNSSAPPTTGSTSDGNPIDDEEGGEGSVTGGEACETPPVCDGDVVQCAIVEQSWRSRCVEEVEPADMVAAVGLTDADGDGVEEGNAEGLPGSGDAPMDVMEDFDSDGWLTSRACPATYGVDLGDMGGEISVSLADACWFFQAIGSLVLVMAAYTAARIVVGGF